jgi:hypothetical protein
VRKGLLRHARQLSMVHRACRRHHLPHAHQPSLKTTLSADLDGIPGCCIPHRRRHPFCPATCGPTIWSLGAQWLAREQQTTWACMHSVLHPRAQGRPN